MEGIQSRCKPCARTYSQRRRAENWKRLFAYKGGECEHCGMNQTDYPSVYDYHHIDPAEKEHGVGRMMHGKWETIKREADKCLLLCANCHRIEHHKLREQGDV